MSGKRSAVYVDGYNLYYGRIRGTAFKWLDPVALSERLLKEQDPSSSVSALRYFSAHCLARFATHGQASVLAQQSYLRALVARHHPRLTIQLGSHSFDRNGALLPAYVEGQPFDRSNRVRVWKLEEKQTDVNLALAMYRDACSGEFEQLVVVSNDSDVAPALKAIRSDFPALALGVVTPKHPPDSDRTHRNTLSSLSDLADWTRHYLRDEELAACQLPARVPTGKRPIDKPVHW